MAEPLGIIGVVGVATQLIQITTKFGMNWKDAPSDVQSFLSELKSLKAALSVLHTNLQLNPDLKSAFSQRQSALLLHLEPTSSCGQSTDTQEMLSNCHAQLNDLLGQLQKQAGGHRLGWERIKRAMLSSRLREGVEDVRRRCDVLNDLVEMDTLSVVLSTHKEVQESRKEHSVRYEESKAATEELRSKVDMLNNKQDSEKGRLDREAILSWLSTIDYYAEQHDHLSRRQPGTGQWLLNSVEYQTWLSTSGQTLFCPGMPGAGKTIITSIAIHDTITKFRDDCTVGIAYLYL